MMLLDLAALIVFQAAHTSERIMDWKIESGALSKRYFGPKRDGKRPYSLFVGGWDYPSGSSAAQRLLRAEILKRVAKWKSQVGHGYHELEGANGEHYLFITLHKAPGNRLGVMTVEEDWPGSASLSSKFGTYESYELTANGKLTPRTFADTFKSSPDLRDLIWTGFMKCERMRYGTTLPTFVEKQLDKIETMPFLFEYSGVRFFAIDTERGHGDFDTLIPWPALKPFLR